MAKNTRDTAFRRINVDEYDEDSYQEDDSGEKGQNLGPNQNEITNLLNRGDSSKALKLVLDNAPVESRDQKVKDAALTLALRVLLSVKTAQMEEIVKGLDRRQLETLLKYVYRGFEAPSESSSAQLLAWHEKVRQVTGVGSIVRVLTDRKRV